MDRQELLAIFDFFSSELEKTMLLFKKVKIKRLTLLKHQPIIQKNKTFQKLSLKLKEMSNTIKTLFFSYKEIKNMMTSRQSLSAKIDTISRLFKDYKWRKKKDTESFFEKLTKRLSSISIKFALLDDRLYFQPKSDLTVHQNLSSEFIKFVSIQ